MSAESNKQKCCLGLAYYNRTLEQQGKGPVCMGLRQVKEGDIDHSDNRLLPGSTLDFKFYCLGYSVHPDGASPSRPGEEVTMPYCEGLEVAITEEQQTHMPAQPALRTSRVSSESPRDADAKHTHVPDQPALPAYNQDSAPAPSATSRSTDDTQPGKVRGEDEASRTLQSRFLLHAQRNLEALRSGLMGDIKVLEKLPVKLKEFSSTQDVQERAAEVAQRNLLRISNAATLISNTAYFRVKEAVLERIRGGPGPE